MIHNEDCLKTMANMPPDCVDLVVTSPPYDDLRTYDGYCFDFQKTSRALWRVMKPGGVVVWVVGDQTKNGSETGTSFRQALGFMDAGFRLHDTMIYQKHNFSNPSRNRYHQIFEYMFVLSKGAPKTFNPIKDRPNVCAGKVGSWGRNTVTQPDGTKKERPRKVNAARGMRYNLWRIKTESKPDHPAQFPYQLAADQIYSWSNEGDLVYDPMAGAGTVALASERLNRKWVVSEISSDYCEVIKDRLA